MFTTPSSAHLTPQQARSLDDDLFGSHPLEYFNSRIHGLVAAPPPHAGDGADTALGRELARRLGAADFNDVVAVTADDRALQVAADSYVLRHHVAEATLRLYHALTAPIGKNEETPCVWLRLAAGPRTTVSLVDATRNHLLSDKGRDGLSGLLLPPGTAPDDEDATTALNVMAQWLFRAMFLLTRQDIDINAGHNKTKHGFAVRSTFTHIAFTTAALTPGQDIPLTAVTGPDSTDIVNGATLDFLSRPAKTGDTAYGWEVTTLKLTPPVLLAEAQLMAVTHAAMFALAARRHFRGRDDAPQPLPTYPTLPQGPTPEALLGRSVTGIRRPFTLPPSGATSSRAPAIAFEDGSLATLEVDVEGHWSGALTDSTEAEPGMSDDEHTGPDA